MSSQLGEMSLETITVPRSLNLKVTSLLFLYIYNVVPQPAYCCVSHVGEKDQLHTDLKTGAVSRVAYKTVINSPHNFSCMLPGQVALKMITDTERLNKEHSS